MKYLLLLCVFFSTSLYANELKGSWVTCDSEGPNYHYEHFIQFDKNNIEFEMHIIHRASKKPCDGEVTMGFSRYWHYEIDGDKFKSTLFNTYALIFHKSVIDLFNQKKICGITKWKVEERADCTNEKMGGFELPMGHKSEHRFHLKGNILEVTDDEGDTSLYTKDLESSLSK